MDITAGFFLSAFFAGILTFLAPCTLPLAPAYLAFISGVSLKELNDETRRRSIRKRVLLNGALYVLGFSIVFIFLGALVGLGAVAVAKYRPAVQQASGIVIIFFALYLLNVLRMPFFQFLNSEKTFPLAKFLTPGKPANSFLFGAVFALGWTPCIGPILGAILTLAANSATVAVGAMLLAVFSAGLGIPFLLIAVCSAQAYRYIKKIEKYLRMITVLGGVLLLILGVLILTNNVGVWSSFFYRYFNML